MLHVQIIIYCHPYLPHLAEQISCKDPTRPKKKTNNVTRTNNYLLPPLFTTLGTAFALGVGLFDSDHYDILPRGNLNIS